MIRFLREKVRAVFEYRDTVRAVRSVFGIDARTREQKLVLAWLADQCHASETVSRETPEDTYRAIGRREVWLSLQDVLAITEGDLRELQEEVATWARQ